MNANELKNSLTKEDIIYFVEECLGSDGHLVDNAGNLIFQTVCHNPPGEGKYKLYYYAEAFVFHCYTECSCSFDIYELVQKAGKANNFVQAFDFVANFFGISRFSNDFIEDTSSLTMDWDLLEKYSIIEGMNMDIDSSEQNEHSPALSMELLNFFNPQLPSIWLKEGISCDAMRKYHIKTLCDDEKIIIPHFDINGKLVGIRARSYNWSDLNDGRKYSPVTIQKTMLNHPLGLHLYGLNFNKSTIMATKKAVLVEGEKSVLKAETFYPNYNFVVACCGSNVSETQVNLLLKLGVNEIIIAFDKENDSFPGSEVSVKYLEKLKAIAQKFTPYVNVYILFDFNNLLDYKDSPFDKGKKVLEQLMSQKILVPSFEGNSQERNKKGGKK